MIGETIIREAVFLKGYSARILRLFWTPWLSRRYQVGVIYGSRQGHDFRLLLYPLGLVRGFPTLEMANQTFVGLADELRRHRWQELRDADFRSAWHEEEQARQWQQKSPPRTWAGPQPWWEVLGFKKLDGITIEEARRRYHRRALQYHPDLHPEDAQAEEEMKLLNLAWEQGQAYCRRGA